MTILSFYLKALKQFMDDHWTKKNLLLLLQLTVEHWLLLSELTGLDLHNLDLTSVQSEAECI